MPLYSFVLEARASSRCERASATQSELNPMLLAHVRLLHGRMYICILMLGFICQ